MKTSLLYLIQEYLKQKRKYLTIHESDVKYLLSWFHLAVYLANHTSLKKVLEKQRKQKNKHIQNLFSTIIYCEKIQAKIQNSRPIFLELFGSNIFMKEKQEDHPKGNRNTPQCEFSSIFKFWVPGYSLKSHPCFNMYPSDHYSKYVNYMMIVVARTLYTNTIKWLGVTIFSLYKTTYHSKVAIW